VKYSTKIKIVDRLPQFLKIRVVRILKLPVYPFGRYGIFRWLPGVGALGRDYFEKRRKDETKGTQRNTKSPD